MSFRDYERLFLGTNEILQIFRAETRVYGDHGTAVAPPVSLTPPDITGDLHIGATAALSEGTWAPGPVSVTRRLLVEGADRGGSHTFGPEDDGKMVSGLVRAANAGGESAWIAATGGGPVTWPAAGRTGDIAAQTLERDSSPPPLDAAPFFTGALGGVWSVSGAGALIDAAGRITIPTDEIHSETPVVVSYTNSGGTQSQVFLVTVRDAPADPGPLVIVIAGQSNAVGRAEYDGLGTHAPDSWAWNGSHLISISEAAMLPHADSGATAGKMGFSVALSETLRTQFPDRQIVFIPCAVGQTSFAEGHWTAGTGAQYLAMTARVNSYFAAHPGHEIHAMCWHQGEYDRAATAAYPARLSAMIAQARADIPKLATAPWVLGQVQDFISPQGSGPRLNNQIGRIPYTVPFTAVVPALGLAIFDTFHFDAPSLRMIGARYGAAIARAAGNGLPAPEPTGTLLAEWYLGSDNAGLTSVAGSHVLTPRGAAPVLGAGFVTTVAGTANGLESPFPETGAMTMMVAFRVNGAANTVIAGNIPTLTTAPGMGILRAGSTTRLSVNLRGRPVGNTNIGNLPSGQWCIAWAALSTASRTPSDPGIPCVAGAVITGAETEQVHADDAGTRTVAGARNPGIGDVGGYAAYANPVDVAWMAIFDGRLSDPDIRAAYTAAHAQLMARGISVPAFPG